MFPKYLEADEVADLLKVKRQTLSAWRHYGKGPRSVKLGGRVVYLQTDLEGYFEEQRRKSGVPGPESAPIVF